MPAETSQTLDRGVRLLRLLAEAPAGLTVTELAAGLGINRTNVYRLLATLDGHGLVRRDVGARASRVMLGLGVLRLTGGVHGLLRQAALPVLRLLADEVGATAHLTVAEGGEALAVAVVEPSWTEFHVAYRTGARHPLELGAAGRAILARRAGRTDRFEVSAGELQPGAHGVAAPLPAVAELEASVGVVLLGELRVPEVGPRVVRAAAELAERLR